MQSQLQAAINQICAEKNIDQTVVIDAIENGIALAYKKDFGRPTQKIKVILGDDISDLKIFEEREVVGKVEDYDLHITEKDAKKINPVIKVGEIVYVPLKLEENFGRIAAQTAKHVMGQKLQEAEREMLFKKFSDRAGEMLTARVQKVDRDATLVEIEGITTLMYARQQIPGEKYFTGQRLKVFLEAVELTPKGPQLKITRTSKKFIESLFEAEIPEMREGLVYIAQMAREPGVRCKLAVASEDSGIDPVGAFVGQRGSRINSVMEEVGDERLDVIQFYEDPKKLLIAALSPAKIAKVEFFKERNEDRVKIFVREEERAITIGRKGQNVRLAGQLVGMQIDVITFDGPIEEDESATAAPEAKKKEKKAINEKLTIERLDGVEPAVIATLMELGLSQIKQFEGLHPEELAEIGITMDQAESVIKAVKKFLS
ncbi:transcription termination factor NusA [bacterium]|jgi:transcription termination/antitermination protein NusA|nr:transcription termination factor NusA [bacterium]MBT6831934.1 transcription termination factor NusA [bacterium]MBT6996630.1 transcription termination factor NusA [bacterium]MBT7773050.1 transcription termination factor NusA [bacterium]